MKLVSSKDWDTWISIVRSKTVAYDIWDLIDPSNIVRPTHFANKPAKPEPILPPDGPDPVANGANQAAAIALYKVLKDEHKYELEGVKEQKASSTKIIDFMHDTVTKQN
ncbi:MAG: hypothetical protein LQ349_000312 [Xanthoria aureola]|nr:MAG: hypothetical protein LQ349_000312 [Xanthoria aureola]